MMPVHRTISHPQRLVVAVAKDPVTVADIEQCVAGVTAEGDNLRALGQCVMVHAQHGQVGPVAIVAASDESHAQARIFADASTVRRPLQTFRERHAARRWLDEQRVEGGSGQP